MLQTYSQQQLGEGTRLKKMAANSMLCNTPAQSNHSMLRLTLLDLNPDKQKAVKRGR